MTNSPEDTDETDQAYEDEDTDETDRGYEEEETDEILKATPAVVKQSEQSGFRLKLFLGMLLTGVSLVVFGFLSLLTLIFSS